MQQQGPDANALEKYSKRLLIVFLILTVRARPRAAQMPRILRTFRRAQGTYAIYILAAIITMAIEDTLELMLDVLGAIIFIFCCAGVLLSGRHSLRNKDKNMMLFFIPVGVGLIASYSLVSKYLAAILVASIVSTVLVIVVVGMIVMFAGIAMVA